MGSSNHFQIFREVRILTYVFAFQIAIFLLPAVFRLDSGEIEQEINEVNRLFNIIEIVIV
jgi:hypothetical protein